VLLHGLAPLLVDAVVTIVGGIRSVDGPVVLNKVLLDSLGSLLQSGWGRWLLASRRNRGGLRRRGTVASCDGGVVWGELSHPVVSFPCVLNAAVVLLVFLSDSLETVLHAFSGEGAGVAVGV